MALSRDWIVFWTAATLVIAACLASMGCVTQGDIDRVEGVATHAREAVVGLNNVIEQMEANLEAEGKEIPAELAEAKQLAATVEGVANAALADLQRIQDAKDQSDGSLEAAFNIATIFSGPYAPVVTGLGALFGIGGGMYGRKKNKEVIVERDAKVAAVDDLDSLARTMVNVAARPNTPAGVIDANDELTKALLDNMNPGASTAIRKAQGKKV